MLSLCATASAQEKTFKAIFCKSSTTLYFVYDTETYTKGGTFTPEEPGSTPLVITEVYTTPRTSTGDQWGDYDTRFDTEKVNFQSSFAAYRPTSLKYWFYLCNYLKTFENISNLNTSSVEDMSYMFQSCSGLTSLDLSSWNTAKVTDMSYMFESCSKLESLTLNGNFNTSKVTDMSHMFESCYNLTSLDLSSWDTSNVEDMSYMFANFPTFSSMSSNLGSLDLSSWNTSKVTDMNHMFYNCVKLADLTLGDKFDTPEVTDMSYMFANCALLSSLEVSSWDTSKVEDMSYMFQSCSKLTSTLENPLDVKKWKTSKVTNMSNMFYGCSKLSSLDLSGWNTSEVTDMSSMFRGCSNLSSLDVSGIFNTSYSKVTNMSYMFASCSKLKSLDMSHWDTSKVTDMSFMFYYCECSKLKSLNLSSFDTSNVTDMNNMFSHCISLTSLTFGDDFNTSKVTNMSNMFNYCNSLTSLDVSKFNTSNVTNMSYMFNSCYKLKSLDVSKFNTSKVTDMAQMFSYCFILESPLDVSHFDTSNVTDMQLMFCECDHLTSIDVSKWNTSKVTNMKEMFYMGTTSSNPSRLTSLDVSKWDTSNVTDMSGMFFSCKLLPSLDVSKWNTSKVTNMNGMFFNCENLPSLDLSGFNTSKVTDMAGMFGQCANLTSLTFPATFSMDNVSTTDYKKRNGMFFGDVKLRYIDFSASNDADAITTIDRGNDKMFDNVPITTVIYLPHGAAKPSGDLQNVVYTSGSELRCDDYYSEDKTGNNSFYNEIELPYSFQTNRAQYSRTMSTKFGTCVLPYEFHSNSNIQAYTLTQEHPATMYFEEADVVPAHTSFLFQKLGNAEFIEGELGGDYNITVNATHDTSVDGPYTHNYDVKAEETTQIWTTKGYYVNKVIDADNGTFYIAQDKFWKATTETTIPPHRATFCGAWYYPESQGAPSFSIMIADHNGGATRISALDIDREDAAPDYFDASGRRHNEPQPGLNIVRKADGTVVKMMRK